MVVNNFLHLYLNKSPDEFEIKALLTAFGFRFSCVDIDTDVKEPKGFHWVWSNPPLSTGGFKLVFYHRLFSDDLFFGRFNSYVILAADHTSSDMDLNALDVFACLLVRRYGGIIYNPEAEENNMYLSGLQQPPRVVKPEQLIEE